MTIRDGLKWCDGTPVNTDDVKFLWELYGDKRITPSFPTTARTQGAGDGTPGKLTIADNLKFTITFDKPYGEFVAALASWIPGFTLLFRPAHFIKQFHADYTSMDKIQPVLHKLKINSWQKLVFQMAMEHWNLTPNYAVGVPSLSPWILTE